jgi:hypothetical protein
MSFSSTFQLRQDVRQSLWAMIPLVGTFIGAVLAWIDLRLEDRITLTVRGCTHRAPRRACCRRWRPR